MGAGRRNLRLRTKKKGKFILLFFVLSFEPLLLELLLMLLLPTARSMLALSAFVALSPLLTLPGLSR